MSAEPDPGSAEDGCSPALAAHPPHREPPRRTVDARRRRRRPPGLLHAYGVAAVVAGVLLPTVAAVLGHAHLTTTVLYTTAIGAQARELVSRMWD